jgi:hypothetical protein
VGAHLAAAVGGAVQREVVDHHRRAVGGALHVQLHPVGAVRHRQAEAAEGVLRRLEGGAAVTEDQGPAGKVQHG